MDNGKGGYQGNDSNGGSKGGAAGKGMCKFFLQGTCTRGASCAFSHGDGGADDEDDPDMLEIHAAIDKAQGRGCQEDDEMLDHLEDLAEEARVVGIGFPKDDDDGGSSQGDPLPPPASEAEIAEAQRIVQKAQEELAERNKMKAKVKDCTQNDLQAMINARMMRK